MPLKRQRCNQTSHWIVGSANGSSEEPSPSGSESLSGPLRRAASLRNRAERTKSRAVETSLRSRRASSSRIFWISSPRGFQTTAARNFEVLGKRLGFHCLKVLDAVMIFAAPADERGFGDV